MILYLLVSRTKWIICNSIPLLWSIIQDFGFLVCWNMRAGHKRRSFIHTQNIYICMWIIRWRLYLETIPIEPWKMMNSWAIVKSLTNDMPVVQSTKNKKEFQMKTYYIPRDSNQSPIHQFLSICNFQFCSPKIIFRISLRFLILTCRLLFCPPITQNSSFSVVAQDR